MMAGWLLYCVAVSLLLGVGAAVIDAVLTAYGRPARWVWAVAIAATLAVPTGAYLVQQRPPRPLPGAGDVRPMSLADRTPMRASERRAAGTFPFTSPAPRLTLGRVRMPE